jgi:hypothetical protein
MLLISTLTEQVIRKPASNKSGIETINLRCEGLHAERAEYAFERRTVILGAGLMAVGHFMMAFEPLFLLALFTLILDPGRRPLRAGRPSARPRLFDLLRRYQCRRVPRTPHLRHARRGAVWRAIAVNFFK